MWPLEESSDEGRELRRRFPSSSCSLLLLLQHTAACLFAIAAEEKDCHGMPLHLAVFFVFAASSSLTCRCVLSASLLPWQHLVVASPSAMSKKKKKWQRRRKSIPSAMVAPCGCIFSFRHGKRRRRRPWQHFAATSPSAMAKKKKKIENVVEVLCHRRSSLTMATSAIFVHYDAIFLRMGDFVKF
ncbi:hypothetical protein AAHE18_04G012900 [Arachis hypogaea]